MSDSHFTSPQPSTSAPALVTAGYEDGQDTMTAVVYDPLNLMEAFRLRDNMVMMAAIKGQGKDEGKVIFVTCLPERDVPLTETEQRLFEAIKRNFYRGRNPKVARMRQAPQDTTVF